ncbi:MAG: endonuclease MutS2 [Peptococcaceae bacterium]|nr:endonuclease MutS2 [Peptococcaceae bacterium]
MRIAEKALNKLEYHRVRERLADHCHLELARQKALTLAPVADFDRVQSLLKETEEARDLLRVQPSFSVRGSKEIHTCLERCEHGGMILGPELVDIKDTLNTARRVRSGIVETTGRDLSNKTTLARIAETIVPLKPLEEALERSLSEEGEVTDRASAELARVRGAIAAARQRIKSALDQVLRQGAYQKMLQDPLVTTRGERYVVPIKQEYVSAFPGIVHDQSASGATVFIEPMAVVQLGNSLREATVREKQEVERVLRLLTSQVAEHLDEILTSYEALVALDFIVAKARLAQDMRAEEPELLRRPQVKLAGARHPLLEGDVVPLTVELGEEYDWLVVTGPNTGGKTVAIKTLALMVIMTQCGLHIPVEGHSSLGVFEGVFVDIGDEQSVEQSLSTFSGHMANVIDILAEADESSLVFFDEIGAGTDPSEGAALAMAIVEDLLRRGCRGMATTHYGTLKTFAYNTHRVENASVEFDVESLRPTYRMITGIPGRSNAFAIAERLGLGTEVLSQAQEHLSERQSQMAHLLESLEESQREAERQRKELEREREELVRQKEDLNRRGAEAEEKSRILVEDARDQALSLVQEARRETQKIVQEIKAAQKLDRRDQDRVMERVRQETKRLADSLDEGEIFPDTGGIQTGSLRPDQIKPGQKIYLAHLGENGHVVALSDKNNEVIVQVGVLKMTVPLAQIRVIDERGETGKKGKKDGGSAHKGNLDKAMSMRSEIDVRGKLVDEAEEKLDKYFDDAVLGGITQVSVIHGKGTGALRAGVHAFLKRHPHVAAFRLGEVGEGDSGVTVVELR